MHELDSTYRNKQVLVTGGAGFIGSNLVRTLVDLGAHVTAVDSLIPDYGGSLFNLAGYEQRCFLNIADVRDPYSMNYLVQGKDYLFSLAGQVSHLDSMRNPYIDLDVNVRAQLSILEACRLHNPAIRIVFASTRQIYGRPRYVPVDEAHPITPVDVNGINKAAAEHYYLLYHRTYGIPVHVLRLTNVYGPRMRVKDARQTFVGWWLRQIVEGQGLRIFGDGQQLRDLNYVDDVVEAMLLAGARPGSSGEVYNMGSEPISLLDLAKLLVEVAGQGSYELVPFPSDRAAIDIGSYYGEYKKIREQIGWSPRVSLRDGLRESVAYYRAHLTRYL
jgi:UDP-glucose 4-epimerase